MLDLFCIFFVFCFDTIIFFFRILQSRLHKYIWGITKPRVPRSILTRGKLQGGLGVPNFLKYFQLAQITFYHTTAEVPLWVGLEAADLFPLSVSNILWIH